MTSEVRKHIAALDRMTVGQLRARFAEVFGEATAANNRTWLVRRIAWRLQAAAEGGLSERARARAAELAGESTLRVTAPAGPGAEPPATGPTKSGTLRPAGDRRLPPPGSILVRKYKGVEVRVTVRPDGFEYAGEVYGSLSAAAHAVTGSHCNGFAFFGLTAKEGTR